ncbi:MAG: transglutaminase domain-containing protein [Treponema sp.]|jgi:transglutaminase-like putative cysteine protease|nr:transglutaminase domain-containing protein [Treponema sp.]
MNLAYQSVPLPEDVQKLRAIGDFASANRLIIALLKKDLPCALRQRLEIETHVLDVLAHDEYPYSIEAAQQLMKERIRDFTPDELDALKADGEADWAFVAGEPRFHRRFFDNLLKTRDHYRKRLLTPEMSERSVKRKEQLDRNVDVMRKDGGRSAEIRLRASVQVKKAFEEAGRRVLVHLPIPREARQTSNITLLGTWPASKISVAPLDAEQRTVCFEATLVPDSVFWVEYAYCNQLEFVSPEPAAAKPGDYDFCLEEQAPHIRFTPYLRFLLEEILDDETNPLKKARRIYDFITRTVRYSFMPEYAIIENIAEYAAVNLKGDCGVQAILFITLCRMAGVPARWQSGLSVSEFSTGCHDWAEFYVEPWGWLFVDPSFGGGAVGSGALDRWNYYFGNLDIFRMAANSAVGADFVPPKQQFRADPVDNQTGEVEYEDHALLSYALETTQSLVSFKDGAGIETELTQKA